MCCGTGKQTVCRRVRASFSPDILQAGAVKGLKGNEIEDVWARTYVENCANVHFICVLHSVVLSIFIQK